MAAPELPLVDVDRLQIGMYVVLDVGWRAHPFAFNSFTIRSEDQLVQLRSLGRRQVRYCPERSSVGPRATPVAATPPPPPPIVVFPASPQAPIEPLAERDPLRRQELSLRRAEGDFRRLAQQSAEMHRLLLVDAPAARRLVDSIGDAMQQWAADERELAIRLLSSRVGEPTSTHEIAVSTLAVLLGRECGFDAEQIRHTAQAALLHDAGKLQIPAFLHEDHGRLTEFERTTYRRHVPLSVEIAESLDMPHPVLRAIAEHHERHDGSGFPAGLRGEQMSPIGQVLAIANRYHNLVSPLQVGAGASPHQALQRMYGIERTLFDPVMLPRFVRILGIYPPGTIVELSDRRMAIVVAARPGRSLSPRVQVLERPDDEEATLAFDLEPDSELRVRCSVRPDQLNPRWAQRARQLARAPIFVEPEPVTRDSGTAVA